MKKKCTQMLWSGNGGDLSVIDFREQRLSVLMWAAASVFDCDFGGYPQTGVNS